MKIELLISTMNRDDLDFLGKMNISTDVVIVNQNSTESKQEFIREDNILKFICSSEKGLSKSRNKALNNSTSDICVLTDDDVIYEHDYKDIITQAYTDHSDADIIAFQVERIGGLNKKKFRGNSSWENYITCLKISSVEITFKRNSIIDNDIKFNELMGSGAEFYLGEENVFLYDALKKGLKILYVPIKIASVDCSKSSWFEGYTKRYFNSVGAAHYNMLRKFSFVLSLQFALRKYKLYKSESSFMSALLEMIRGAKKYKKYDEIKRMNN